MQNQTDWSMLLSGGQKEVVTNFITGKMTKTQTENKLRFSDAAGEFRKLIRSRGTSNARQLGMKALRRRNLV